jgi:hypothetical protein
MIFSVEPKYIVSAVCKTRKSVHQEVLGKMTSGMGCAEGKVIVVLQRLT